MGVFKLNYKPFGHDSILINWPQKIDENILFDLLKFKKILLDHYDEQTVEIINAYNSITIYYLVGIRNIYDEISTLKSIYSAFISPQKIQTDTWEVPVCYDDEFGIDLNRLARDKNLTIDQIIEMHSGPLYRVYFYGFLPGFLYLGGLKKTLSASRLDNPRPKVAAGSVAIGENQTGIYPVDSPGGWNIIGRCPIQIFNPQMEVPCQINPGDCIRFKAISRTQYEDIKTDSVKSGQLIKINHDNC